jgi:hypothetical protein
MEHAEARGANAATSSNNTPQSGVLNVFKMPFSFRGNSKKRIS